MHSLQSKFKVKVAVLHLIKVQKAEIFYVNKVRNRAALSIDNLDGKHADTRKSYLQRC